MAGRALERLARGRWLRVFVETACLFMGVFQPKSCLQRSKRVPRRQATKRAPPPRYAYAAALTSTFFTCAGAGFGTVTLSTPFTRLALMLSGLIPAGSSSVRENEP